MYSVSLYRHSKVSSEYLATFHRVSRPGGSTLAANECLRAPKCRHKPTRPSAGFHVLGAAQIGFPSLTRSPVTRATPGEPNWPVYSYEVGLCKVLRNAHDVTIGAYLDLGARGDCRDLHSGRAGAMASWGAGWGVERARSVWSSFRPRAASQARGTMGELGIWRGTSGASGRPCRRRHRLFLGAFDAERLGASRGAARPV